MGVKLGGLYVISDTGFSIGRGHEEVVLAAIRGGAGVVQLREKALSLKDIYPVALRLRDITRDAGVVFIVNDSVELAMAVEADGVYLGQGDMPVGIARKLLGEGRLIGISTHSLEEALTAEADGADYIGFGPIYKTSTKDSGTPKGPEGLRAIREKINIPIVAIGGIDAENASAVIQAGADAVAVISAVTAVEDITAAAKNIAGQFVKGGRSYV